MAVVIQDFEAVQDGGQGGDADAAGKPPAPAPVAHAALDRLLAARRTRLARLWAN
jgi:hypothetical protein